MYLISLFAFLVLGIDLGHGSGHRNPDQGKWDVTGCIRMNAEITLNLTYYVDKNEGARWDTVKVPANATATGNCNTSELVNGESIPSQSMTLVFDEKKYPGWQMDFFFSDNAKVGAYKDEFVLWKVKIHANYSAMDKFKSAIEPAHVYEETVNLNDGHNDDVSELANSVFANNHYSYFCPSAQTYEIVTDNKQGPAASVRFKDFQVQAYAKGSSWRQRATCPADEHVSDLVPVIVGGCLAGLVLVTLVAYLIYRWRLPPEVLHLTNPNSHFEDVAFDHHGGHKHTSSIEEEDEDSCDSEGSPRIRRHSSGSERRHQNGHVNQAYHHY